MPLHFINLRQITRKPARLFIELFGILLIYSMISCTGARPVSSNPVNTYELALIVNENLDVNTVIGICNNLCMEILPLLISQITLPDDTFEIRLAIKKITDSQFDKLCEDLRQSLVVKNHWVVRD